MTGGLASPIRRVLFVAPRYPSMSGGSTVISNLGAAFRARGIEVEVLSILPGGSAPPLSTRTLISREALHRGPLIRSSGLDPLTKAINAPLVAFKRVDRRRFLRSYRRLMATQKDDSAVIFTHVTCKALLDESGYQRRHGGPLLIGQHHSQYESVYDEPYLEAALRKHFGTVDAFTALTMPDAQKFAALLPVRCVGIGNPAHSGALPVTRYEPHVVSLSRFSHEKRVPLLIELFLAATDTDDLLHWRLDVFGEGEELHLVREAARIGGDRVRISEPTDVRLPLSTASVNLSTSNLEGFGMTFLEAASASIPSIAFDCSPGVRELLEGHSGVLVPIDDQAAYVRALRHLLRSPGTIREIGKRARDMSSNYAPETISAQWVKLFNECRARDHASG